MPESQAETVISGNIVILWKNREHVKLDTHSWESVGTALLGDVDSESIWTFASQAKAKLYPVRKPGMPAS